MSNVPKRHHIVPKLILQHFCNERNKLHCLVKNSGKTFKASPRGLFVQKHLYTERLDDGTTSTHVELDLSRVEAAVAPVVTKVIQEARSGNSLVLPPSERDKWFDFMYSQVLRLPSQRDLVRSIDYVSSIVDGYDKYIQPLSTEERAHFENPKKKKQIADNLWLKSVTPPEASTSQLMSVFKSKGIGAVVIKKQPGSFVIGDNPIIRLPSPSTQLASPEARLLYPVSWDVMVEWGLPDDNQSVRALTDHKSIRALNERSFQQSTMVVGRSKEVLRSLSRRVRGQT